MGGSGEFERKFVEILEEVILNEVRMRGRATINVTLQSAFTHHFQPNFKVLEGVAGCAGGSDNFGQDKY